MYIINIRGARPARSVKRKMEKEKKYSGYGYHGGGRKKSETPLKKFSISAKLPAYELIKSEAQKAGTSISNFVISAALEKIKK